MCNRCWLKDDYLYLQQLRLTGSLPSSHMARIVHDLWMNDFVDYTYTYCTVYTWCNFYHMYCIRTYSIHVLYCTVIYRTVHCTVCITVKYLAVHCTVYCTLQYSVYTVQYSIPGTSHSSKNSSPPLPSTVQYCSTVVGRVTDLLYVVYSTVHAEIESKSL